LGLSYLISTAISTHAQSYFKSYDSREFVEQKVAEYRNGDLLVANSSITPLQTGDENGVIKLNRIDYCGNHIWTRQFDYSDSYLLLKDIAINQNGDIFLFGSSYKGLIESLFLMKIEAESIDIAEFRIYDPGSVDHFTYSIDLRQDKILIYGLLLDFNSSKEGFIGVLDHNLNILRTSKFVPFESTGDAVFSNDGAIIARSGPYVYKFNTDNQIEWAFTSKNQLDLLNISGPYNAENGWIFESYSNNMSFLYKIDESGQLVWTTDQFSKNNIGGDLTQSTNGQYIYVYNKDENNGTQLSFIIIDQDGRIIEEFFLNHNYTVNTGTVKQRIVNEYLNIIASKNESVMGVVDVENFILQFDYNERIENCYLIENFTNTSPNNIQINLEPLTITSFDFDLELLDRLKLTASTIEDNANDLCSFDNDIEYEIETNIISCGESWSVDLPSEDFQWDDGHINLTRELTTSGSFAARNLDCQRQMVIEYNLEVEDCKCQIYMPNGFSPNGDKVNDTLELAGICDLESMDLTILDKWGAVVFSSKSMDNMWNGKLNQNDVSSGTYAAILVYRWINKNGELLEDKVVQTVSVFR